MVFIILFERNGCKGIRSLSFLQVSRDSEGNKG